MRCSEHLIITLALLALGAGQATAQPLGFSPPRLLQPDAGTSWQAEVASDGAGHWVAAWWGAFGHMRVKSSHSQV